MTTTALCLAVGILLGYFGKAIRVAFLQAQAVHNRDDSDFMAFLVWQSNQARKEANQ